MDGGNNKPFVILREHRLCFVLEGALALFCHPEGVITTEGSHHCPYSATVRFFAFGSE
jgi:hypothetical protein